MATQPIEFPLVAGQDEGSNSKVLPIPRLKRAVNLRRLKEGRFEQIRGTAAIGTATVDPIGASSVAPEGPVRLFTHGSQLLACGESSLFTLSEATNPSKWEEVEDGVETTLAGKHVLGHYGARDVVTAACASTSTFTVYAWMTAQYVAEAVASFHLHVLTVDNATGAGSAGTRVTISTESSDEILPSVKVIALGSKCTVFWSEFENGGLRMRYLDVTSATSGPYATGTDHGTSYISGVTWPTAQAFDVANHGSGYVIAYCGDLAEEVRFARYNAAHTLQATDAPIAITGTDARIGICGNLVDGDATIHLAVVSENAGAGRLEVYGLDDAMATQTTYTATSEPVCLGIAMGEFSDGARSQLVYTGSSVNPRTRLKYFTAGDLDSQSGNIPDAYVCGKPIGRNGKSYFAIQYYTSRPNSSAALVRIDPGFGTPRANLVARPEVLLNQGRGVRELSTGGIIVGDAAHSVAWLNDELVVPVVTVDRYSGPTVLEDPTGDGGEGTTNVVERIGLDAWRFAFGERDRFMTAKVGGYTFLGGGTVLQFDGKRAVELGFWSYPDIDEGDLTVALTGGNLADGTYTYAFVWEWTDWLGNRHQSAAKIINKEVSGGGGSAAITITLPPGMPLTFKQWRIQGEDSRPITLAIYRSRSTEEDVDTGAVVTLHRLEGDGVQPFPENDPNEEASLGDYVDDYNSDTIALVTRELLYTSGAGSNELDNVPPPPSRFLVAHDSRLMGIDDTNPRRIWYSKQMFPGAAAAWNESLYIPLEEDGVALASQDGNLLVFTARGVYTVIGRPADNTGNSTGYEPPQRLSTELGCNNARSVLATPVGTFFESERGIHLLPRGGIESKYIGKPVEDTLATYPTITSVCHVQEEATVLFACVDQETTPTTAAGRVLAYQYDIDQWFVREYASKPVSSMVVHGGDLTLGIYEAADDITVWQEDAGWDDAEGGFIGWTIETGDVRLGGMGGRHRINDVHLLGECFATCRVQIREKVDYGAWQSPATWTIIGAETEVARRYQTRRPLGNVHSFELSQLQQGETVDSRGVAPTGLVIYGTPLGDKRLSQSKTL